MEELPVSVGGVTWETFYNMKYIQSVSDADFQHHLHFFFIFRQTLGSAEGSYGTDVNSREIYWILVGLLM